MGVLNAAEIVAGGGVPENDLTVVLIGESHNDQFNIGGAAGQTSVHWLNQLNADPRVRGAFKVIANYAISGEREDEWAPAQVQDAIDSTAKVVVFGGWVNGMATPNNHTADQVMNGWASGAGPAGAADSFLGLLYYADLIVQAGKILIWPSDWGQEGYSAAQITQANIANQRRRAWCRNRANVHALERNAIMWDGTGATIAFRTGFANDAAPHTHASARSQPSWNAARNSRSSGG